MKVVSFNVGLLVYDLIKIPLFTTTPFVKERLKVLPSVLRDSQADLICLQEIYHIDHKFFLSQELKDQYPFIYFEHKGFRLAMENGLMILSKQKLKSFEQFTFKDSRWEEKLFASTGFQIFSLNNIRFYHIHLTAGGILGPEHKQAELLRQNQIQQLVKDISAQEVIILGDFNCGPTVSVRNYQTIVDAGFMNITSDKITWDPQNPLNSHGIHAHCPPQSIDHVMANFVMNAKSSVCFDDAIVDTKKGKVTPSDHYGVCLDI